MPKKLEVLYENKPCYNIIIENNFEKLVENIIEISPNTDRKVCIFTDDLVGSHYEKEVRERLIEKFNLVITYTIPNGENSKTLSNVEKLYEELIKNHFDRRDLLIALGGGVVGDMTGFAAATYLRGIDFIQVPTSLLSQVDSSIGGKTGVDYLQYKNMVGAFYMPKLVYINTATLNTLSDAQLASGMGEVVKHGLIRNEAYYAWMETHSAGVLARDPQVMEELIYESCKIKKAVVEEDPKEQGIRAYLNFGHTLGHAIERLSNFQLFHGQCVSLGMACASYISWKRGYISEADYTHVLAVLETFHLPTKLSLPIAPQDVVSVSKSDKKMVGKRVKFVLLHGIGNAAIDMDVSDEEMLEALATLSE